MPDDGAPTVFEQPTPVVVGDNADDIEETEEMAIDLPENVAGLLLKSGTESYQALMLDIQHNGATVHSLTRFGAVKAASELDTIESRANSGLAATPYAPPTTQ